jgi:tetratricopeptide (TPR) repeat protein
MFAYALTIFTGAFLLFLVQPLIGKYVLPWFGGAPGVWTTCLLFFQVLLLGGYAYAHFISRRFRPRNQALLHLVLVAVALALLPITPGDSWKPDGTGDPTRQILGLLLASIGLPYFVLSATGPLMQHWFSRTNPGVSPYRLYALSNVGSLLALATFPVCFEPHFTRVTQARLWGWGLAVYALACGFCAVKLWKAQDVEGRGSNVEGSKSEIRTPESASLNPQPSTFNLVLWVLLPACASVLLLATTNMMCQEVAVIPFLWVLPLGLYLLSFIICFDHPRWYRRFPFLLALAAAWGGVAWVLFQAVYIPIHWQLGVYASALFVCCMVCHGEVYRLRPDPRHLTGFYLMIATGGALGGLFVAVIAPLIFTGYYELQWGLVGCGLLLLAVCVRDWNLAGFQRWRVPVCAGLSAGVVALGVALWLEAHRMDGLTVWQARNFYGVLKVTSLNRDAPDQQHRELIHGRTKHGSQFVAPERARWPTLYYSERSGVGLAMSALPGDSRRIGVIGLGAGTLAVYGRATDYIHIYEINPEVIRIATSWFTFLANFPGQVEITRGDARLSLEREPPQNFDLLVLDAFNSDAIPVHLLTREAFAIYERHLKTNGIIAVHVSNKGLNLEPVVVNLARNFHFELAVIDYHPPPDQPWLLESVWMLLSHNRQNINTPEIRLARQPPDTNSVVIPLWTDDFTSLFQIVRSRTQPQADTTFANEQSRIANDLGRAGNFAEAAGTYRRALQTHPDSAELNNNLAWLLASCPDASVRDGAQAVKYAERACVLTRYGVTPMVGTLAAAYAEAGRFDDAIAMGEKACAMASETGDQGLLRKNQELLELYRAHEPYHEPLAP